MVAPPGRSLRCGVSLDDRAGARSGRAWREVRAEPHAKEIHFDPVVRGLSLAHSPGGGREILGRQAAKNYTRVRALCPELTEIEQIIRRP